MRTMKRTIWALCGVMWMSIPGYSTGDVRYDEPQEKETSFKEIPNPEKAARKRVDELDKVLHLSKKQYKKIYKLLLKEERDRLEQGIGYMSMRTERPLPPMGGGYPPAGGGHLVALEKDSRENALRCLLRPAMKNERKKKPNG